MKNGSGFTQILFWIACGTLDRCRLVDTNPTNFIEARFFWPNFRVADTPQTYQMIAPLMGLIYSRL
jgi:hypothetical protein